VPQGDELQRPRLYLQCLRQGLPHLGAAPYPNRPYTPRIDGKSEIFIQTLLQKWAYSMPFLNYKDRNQWLPNYLTIYNRLRKHSALGWDSPQQQL
jgi:transposase InsO family protein